MSWFRARRSWLAAVALAAALATGLAMPAGVHAVLPDEVLDDLRARVDTIGQRLGFQGSVVLLADPDMGPADCRVDWADGGAERIARNVWDDIDAAVKRMFDQGSAAPSPAVGDPT